MWGLRTTDVGNLCPLSQILCSPLPNKHRVISPKDVKEISPNLFFPGFAVYLACCVEGDEVSVLVYQGGEPAAWLINDISMCKGWGNSGTMSATVFFSL